MEQVALNCFFVCFCDSHTNPVHELIKQQNPEKNNNKTTIYHVQ